MGHIKHKKDLLAYAANWIGLSMLLYVFLTLLYRLLGGLVLQGAFSNVRWNDFSAAPEWGLGLYNLVLPVAVLLPPYFVLKAAAKPLKVVPPMGKSRVPVWLLLPLFLGVMVLVNSVSSLISNLLGSGGEVGAMPQTVAGVLLYFVSTCLLSPILEELLFRGMVQGMLRLWGSRFAILVSSVLFTLLHTNLSAVMGVFLLSVLLGYVCEITGTVRAGMVLHFANNLASFVTLLVQTHLKGLGAVAFGFWMTLVFLVLFGAAAWAVRYFRLASRFKLAKAKRNEPGSLPAYIRLLGAPVFIAGLVGILLFFIGAIFAK